MPSDHATDRWDGQSVQAWDGVYGDSLTARVAKFFPVLAADVRTSH